MRVPSSSPVEGGGLRAVPSTPEEAQAMLDAATTVAEVETVLAVAREYEEGWRVVRLRAERRLGEILPPKRPGKRTDLGPVTSGDKSSPRRERMTHNRARKVAAVPEETFEKYVEENPETASREGLLREAARVAGEKSAERKAEIPGTARLWRRVRTVRLQERASRAKWSEEDADDVEALLILAERRPKYSAKRLRELRAKRHGFGLAQARYRMMEVLGVLESLDVMDYDLADPFEAGAFHDDLVELQVWLDRSLALVTGRLDDVAFAEKLAKMRNGAGRTEAEQRIALTLADKLERRRRDNLLA